MTGMVVILLLIGAVFMIGSFFLSERLTASELEKIAGLSETEIKKMVEGKLADASVRIDDTLDEKLAEASESAERAMEKEANEQVMHIHEYSETVLDEMKKAHEENVFLYSMLNDKQAEMTSMAGDLQRLAASIRSLQNKMQKMSKTAENDAETQSEKSVSGNGPAETFRPLGQSEGRHKTKAKEKTETEGQPAQAAQDTPEEALSNDEVLRLYDGGMSEVDIAKKLGRGLGEVKLVIGLYKGDKNL